MPDISTQEGPIKKSKVKKKPENLPTAFGSCSKKRKGIPPRVLKNSSLSLVNCRKQEGKQQRGGERRGNPDPHLLPHYIKW